MQYRQLYSDLNLPTKTSNIATLAGDVGDVDGELCFQQDGATATTARETMD
jgi:hypothetical protein